MRTYIALLRGINVSGLKKIKMADLGRMMQQLGFDDVVTYIQSGNIVFKTQQNDEIKLDQKIGTAIKKIFGFDIPVLITSKKELQGILTRSPFQDPEEIAANKIYYVLLKNEPELHLRLGLQEETYTNERFYIGGNCVYLACSMGYGKAKLNNNLIERKLKVMATTRNHKTMLMLIELAEKG